MGEEGLGAIHKIIKNINDQDERIWRQTAAKKCLKKEIEKIEEQTKRYEIQISTLKKDPLYDKREEIAQSLEDNIKDQVQTHKLLSVTLKAKNEEIERKSEDIKSWDKKYKEAIAELKEAYDLRKFVLESTNPMYKKLLEIEAAEKVAEVRLKQLKATLERRKRSQKQLEFIKKEVFNKTIINFAKAVIRKEKYDEVSSKLKTLDERKKEMVRGMFEAQEALKKQRVSHTRIPSGMFTTRIPNFNMHQGMPNKNEKRRLPDFMPEFNKLRKLNAPGKDPKQLEKNKISDEPNLEEENIEPIILPTPKKNPIPSTNRINILSNKTISLPPLKDILTKKRSYLDTSNRSFAEISFNKSQNSQINSQSESVKKLDSTFELSQEAQIQVGKHQNVQTTQVESDDKGKQSSTNAVNIPKPTNYLKNIKFTGQFNKFDTPNKSSSFNIQNNRINLAQKASILKSQVSKRNLNESFQDDDLDTSQRKKEKNVNFASPIQQQIEINQNSTDTGTSLNLSPSLSITSNRNINQIQENMWISPPKEDNGVFQMGSPSFNFQESNEIHSSTNSPNIPQASIFGDTNAGDSSFGFCFGGASKASGGLWDLFG